MAGVLGDWSYTYDVYGQPFILSTTYYLLPTSAVTNRFLFTGREHLAALALYDYRHRFYSPSLGRFLQTDPLRFDAEDVNLYRYCANNPVNFTGPLGLYVGLDDAVFTVGGALVGLGGQFIGDLIVSARAGSWQFSGWEDYTGSAIGGAVGGEALLYTGPVGAGLAGGAAGNLARQGLKNLSGDQCGFNTKSFALESAVGAASGFIPGARIPGVTAGRGSYNQVYRQIVTKAQNGTISSVTPTTAAKMFAGRAIDTGLLPGTGAAAAAGVAANVYMGDK